MKYERVQVGGRSKVDDGVGVGMKLRHAGEKHESGI